jgi:putative ATPase
MSLFEGEAPRPLADRLRPARISEVVGQDHLLDVTAPIGRMLSQKRLASLILWGPPGCGKTTIAGLLAAESNLEFVALSAVFSGVADLRKAFEAARERRSMGRGTLLFIDEIHRFNRAQQDGFLPYVEDGTVTLIGATTENPSFELNAALLSRAQVFVLRRLDNAALDELISRAEAIEGRALPLTDDGRETVAAMADGDGRFLLNLVEELFQVSPHTALDSAGVAATIQRRAPVYDKNKDEHYNLISALHKSLRGSDTDAALYWLNRMLMGGEDAGYILRRLTRFAVEDIGLADPQAATQAIGCWQIYERLGSPEGDLALSQLVIYLATAPKSNAAYKAQKAAARAAKETGSLMPPKHILNAPTALMEGLGYGSGYQYDHDRADGFSGQDYFPEGLPRQEFYQPVQRGFEREVRKRLAYWQKLRAGRAQDTSTGGDQ